MTKALVTLHAILLVVGSGCTSTPPVAAELSAAAIRGSVCRSAALDPLSASIIRMFESQPSINLSAVATQTCGSSTTCEEYLACYGLDLSMPCTSTPTHCSDETHLVSCEDGHVRTIECGTQFGVGNNSCVTTATASNCGAGPCTTEGARCDGQTLVTCRQGLEQQTDCAALGRTCVASADQATCLHVAEACTEDRCEGDFALDCDSSGLGFTRVDCRLMAGPTGMCLPERGCVAATPECEDRAAECAGDVARFCVNGMWEELDCASFLGATCRLGEVGFFGQEIDCVTE